MMFALKNLRRSPRRTATMLGMIVLGTIALVLAGGYAAATFRGLRENTIGNGLGHLQIGGAGFRDSEQHPLQHGLSDVGALRRAIAADRRVRAVTARIDFTGLVSNGETSVPFMGRAIEPAIEYGIARFPENLAGGRAVGTSDRNETVLGVGLAKALNVKIGDRLTLLSSTVDGALNGADVEIVGVTTTGVREMDERLLVVRLDTAQAILNTDRVSKLVVRLWKTGDTDAVGADLSRTFAPGALPLEIATWSELAVFYHQVRGLYSGIFIFLGLIITCLVVVSSGNSMTMTIVERTREIGTLMAVGTTRLTVLAMFVVEGLGLGVLGAGVGVALGWSLAVGLTRARIAMPPPPTFTTGFPLVIDIVPALGIGVFVLMVATLLAASILPAARAARLRITEALVAVTMLALCVAPASAQNRAALSDPENDARQILERADRFRGGWPSVVQHTRIDNYDGDTLVESADFEVSLKGENSMVRFLSVKNKGQTLLMRGDDMWYFLPSVARPIRITPIQRLLGNASNGDVARVRYSIDYEPTIAGEETVDGTRCTVLELRARRKGATYQRMRYAVRQSDAQPVRAEFFLASGKQIKTAFFQEPRSEAGQTVMTRLVIYDHIKERAKTIMQFSGFAPRDLPDKLFNPARSGDQ
jgi:putative ABC transport system permease protein